MADAIGSNLEKKGKRKAWQEILRLIKRKQMSMRPGSTSGSPPVLTKYGAPASNTSADCPGQVLAWCLDYKDSKVYVCTAYTNSTTFTWTEIV